MTYDNREHDLGDQNSSNGTGIGDGKSHAISTLFENERPATPFPIRGAGVMLT